MTTYRPRPGSKTEAAIDYLRAHGGRATAIDLAEALDTERKNLHSMFSAAIAAGIMEVCDLPAGKGYGLRNGAPDVPAPAAPEAPAPAVAPKPVKAAAPKPVKAAAPKPAKDRAASKPRAPRVATPAPAAGAGSFRCGYFSDGTLRLEGCEPDLVAVGGGYGGINLSPGAAAALTDFLRGQP